MMRDQGAGREAFVVGTIAVAIGGFVLGGCAAAPRLSVQAQRYRLEVSLNPATHLLEGRAILDLASTNRTSLPHSGPVAVELLLHPELKITDVAISGVNGRYRRRSSPVYDDDARVTALRHTIVLAKPVDNLTLFVDYRGKLYQDVAAGEVPGEIHNFDVEAHIAEEGIYLGGGHWYPAPVADDDAEPALAEYTLIVEPIADLELVASAQRDPRLSEQTGRLAWRSPYPIEGLVLVGGKHEVHHGTYNDVAISLHLKPDQAKYAVGLMEAVRRNLDRYEPLIGPYPADEFAIVDNFFSSGFAFPTFTLLSSAVINMGKRSQTAHGYIDHEMLHCWWGNGIQVDPRHGNWCEALASYAANYYGYVLDGDEEQARRKRRNYSHMLSRIKPDRDKPLGTYGKKDGCGRGIAYHKGAAVFEMLARKIGQENFWSAMRTFTREFVGCYASWDDIRHVCEQAWGDTLDRFFDQWIYGGGAPTLAIQRATYDKADQTITLTISQGERVFDLDVPVRISHAEGYTDIMVPMRESLAEITVPVSVIPTTVELDPDNHIFRKIPLDQIVPTTASTRYGDEFTCVVPTGELNGNYQMVKSIFEASFKEEERETTVVGRIEEGALAERCVLILADAVRDAYVSAFLDAIEFPIRWIEDGFEFEGVAYTHADDAVLCTSRHPGVPGGGVTVVYANSDGAAPKGMNIPMYDNGLVIFKNGRPVLRRDFVPQTAVVVKQE
jgi:hypothetical protein